MVVSFSSSLDEKLIYEHAGKDNIVLPIMYHTFHITSESMVSEKLKGVSFSAQSASQAAANAFFAIVKESGKEQGRFTFQLIEPKTGEVHCYDGTRKKLEKPQLIDFHGQRLPLRFRHVIEKIFIRNYLPTVPGRLEGLPSGYSTEVPSYQNAESDFLQSILQVPLTDSVYSTAAPQI
jgi:hypothetical protein